MSISITAESRAACLDFLKIRYKEEPFQLIEDFIQTHPDPSEEMLNECTLLYRGREESYKDNYDNLLSFANGLQSVEFDRPSMLTDKPINIAAFYTDKTIECLYLARHYIIKSAQLLVDNHNAPWLDGYLTQYWFRCVNFGTAVTWLQNAFDHILQSVYFGKKLYSQVVDQKHCQYNPSWDINKILKHCKYSFVVCELKKQGLLTCYEHITNCYSKIENVRSWANYIKHKGGIDYKNLEAESPIVILIAPASQNGTDFPYEVKDFKSPVQIDIDDSQEELVSSYCAIWECINETIEDIDYTQYRSLFD